MTEEKIIVCGMTPDEYADVKAILDAGGINTDIIHYGVTRLDYEALQPEDVKSLRKTLWKLQDVAVEEMGTSPEWIETGLAMTEEALETDE